MWKPKIAAYHFHQIQNENGIKKKKKKIQFTGLETAKDEWLDKAPRVQTT
jgi:hypothetical protein